MSFVRFLAVSLGCVFLAYSSSAVSFSLDGIARGVGGLYIGGMYKPASPIFGDLAFKGSFDTSFRTAPLNALPMLWFAGQDQDAAAPKWCYYRSKLV
ncbi:hypothetical protein [Anaplasma marginale]|uniref:hypothetical protein n=1 Tax=Anaplasma marginale TaxID=770 RepID=UPI000417DF52|nr:hypothetical protein [Anaplasma marginale]